MLEAAVDIKTPDGAMNSYMFRPDGEGPFPVVIFYMDSVGDARSCATCAAASRPSAIT